MAPPDHPAQAALKLDNKDKAVGDDDKIELPI